MAQHNFSIGRICRIGQMTHRRGCPHRPNAPSGYHLCPSRPCPCPALLHWSGSEGLTIKLAETGVTLLREGGADQMTEIGGHVG